MAKLLPINRPQKHTMFLLMATIVVALAGVLFGFGTGVISGAILFIRQSFELSAWMSGVVVSAVLVGALLGSWLSGYFSDHLGCRYLLIIAVFLFIVGSINCAMSSHVYGLILGRLVVGFGIGISSYAAPLYIAEIAPSRWRGRLIALNQLAITVGILVAYLVNYHYASDGNWQAMFFWGVIPSTFLLLSILFLPSTPSWLIIRGLEEKARKVLFHFRGDSIKVEQELNTLKVNTHGELSEVSGWSLLMEKWMRPALMVAIGLIILQQITGINVILYYAPTILAMAGLPGAQTAILATIGIGIINVIFTIIALPFIDYWGRRPLLLLGTIGMLIGLLALSYCFNFVDAERSQNFMPIAVGGMLLYVASFAISLGPISWILMCEVFPQRIRGLGSSVAMTMNWAFNITVGLTFLPLVALLSLGGAFFVFAFITFAASLFIFFKIPETRGVGLECIERNLKAGISARHLGRSSS